MKKTMLLLAVLSTPAFAQDSSLEVTVIWNNGGGEHYADHHPGPNQVLCNREEMKQSSIQNITVGSLLGKLESQTDRLRSKIAREGYVHKANGDVVAIELKEKSACDEVKYPAACKRAVRFEESIDFVKRALAKYDSELRQFQREASGFSEAEDNRREREAIEARELANTLSLGLDRRVQDIRELRMGIESSPIESIEIRALKQDFLSKVDEGRVQEEIRQSAEAEARASRLEDASRDYRPVSNQQVREAKREVVERVNDTVNEYLSLKNIVEKNNELAALRFPMPNMPSNSYDNEMKCASNIFDELAQDVNKLSIQ